MERPNLTSREEGVPAVGEFGLIDRIHQLMGPTDAVIGIGDDTAAFRPAEGYLQLLTVDMLVDGVHFHAAKSHPERIGYQAMAVNLSDIAAMGGTPRYALVSLAICEDTTVEWIEALYRGMRAMGDRFAVSIVGGNITRTPGPLCIDVVLTGEVRDGDIIRRDGAMVGDAVVVTGPLGDAAGARQYLDANGPASALGQWCAGVRPEPRVGAGQALSESHLVHAMMDISDGLGSDIRHICEAGDVGVILKESLLPVSSGTMTVARELGLDVNQLALFGGEDYELVFTCFPNDLTALQTRLRSLKLHHVGSILTAIDGFVLELQDGSMQPLSDLGWKHF